jgi:SAM-dependent methyltransferase
MMTMPLPTQDLNQQSLYQAVEEWFTSPSGNTLLQDERKLITRLSCDVFGYHLLQVQDFGHGLQVFEECPIQQKWSLQASTLHKPDVYALSEFLPLASDSVDLVLLAHTLDFALDPQQVLREAERVLIPEGRVIILGFNPMSRLGLMHYLPPWRSRTPYQGQFLSYHRLHDWLSLLGFAVEKSDVLLMPPLSNTNWMRRWLPAFADIYALRAVKRVSTVRPVKMRRRRSLGVVFGPRVVEPSTRNLFADYDPKS